MSSTSGFYVGGTFTATSGTGTIYGGSPTKVVITAVTSTSITYSVTGGTIPTAGTVSNISLSGLSTNADIRIDGLGSSFDTPISAVSTATSTTVVYANQGANQTLGSIPAGATIYILGEHNTVTVPATQTTTSVENLGSPGATYYASVIPVNSNGQFGVASTPISFTASSDDQIVTAGAIRSATYAPGSAGWIIQANGTAQFNNNVEIYGTIYATGGRIGATSADPLGTGFTISSGQLTAGATTNAIGISTGVNTSSVAFWAGNTTPTSAPFRVTQAGALFASNATITGAITATSGSFTGTISGATITGSNISTGDIYIRENTGGRYYLTYLLGDYLQTKRTNSDYSTITGSGAFIGYYNASTEADNAATIVNSATPYTSGSYVATFSNGNIGATGTVYAANANISSVVYTRYLDVATNGYIGFGDQVRQMINLWSTSYGIGVQNSTQYFRSGQNFAWYTGGSHSDTALDAGVGGTRRMYLSNGDLVVGSSITLGSHTITSDTWRLIINPNNYTDTQIGIGELFQSTWGGAGIFASGTNLTFATKNGTSFRWLNASGTLLARLDADPTSGNFYAYGACGQAWTGTSTSADTLVRHTDGFFYIKSSNRDLKENIDPLVDSFKIIDKLQPVSFNWKKNESDSELDTKIKQEYKSIGFILEDVLDISPELVTWRKNEGSEEIYPGYWKTDDFIALAIQGIKDLKLQVDLLKEEVRAMK
jgi:hypothetical protein